tara:strand:+ start:753 stop:1397 length:645 start_codon:yes stop_codon:yes gene_type:complete
MDFVHWFELGIACVAISVGVAFGIHRMLKGKDFMLLEEKKEQLQFPTSCFWATHTRVHETLTELRVKTDCARAQLVQFHNSGHFLDGISMKKMSLTHESLEKGVSSEMGIKKDLLLSMCIDGLTLLLEDDPQLYMVSNMEDSWCKQFMENSNVVSFSFLPLRRQGLVIGYIMCQWCSWTKSDSIEEEEMVAEVVDARNLIEIQLEQELSGTKKR